MEEIKKQALFNFHFIINFCEDNGFDELGPGLISQLIKTGENLKKINISFKEGLEFVRGAEEIKSELIQLYKKETGTDPLEGSLLVPVLVNNYLKSHNEDERRTIKKMILSNGGTIPKI